MGSERGIHLPLFELYAEGFHFSLGALRLICWKKIYIGTGALVGIKPLLPLLSYNCVLLHRNKARAKGTADIHNYYSFKIIPRF